MLKALKRRRDVKATRELLEQFKQLDCHVTESRSTFDGTVASYAVTVPSAAASDVRDIVHASGLLPVTVEQRARMTLTTPTGLPLSIATSLSIVDLAHLLAEAVEHVDQILAAGQPIGDGPPLPAASISAAFTEPYMTSATTAIIVNGVIDRQFYAAIDAGPFGARPAPTAVHEIFTTLLLDAAGLPSDASYPPDQLWKVLSELVANIRTNPSFLDSARALADPQPADRTETRPVAVTTPRTAAAHEAPAPNQRDPR